MNAGAKHKTWSVKMFVREDTQYYHFCEEDIQDIRELMFEEKSFECETWKQEAIHYKNLYESTVQSIINYVK